MRRLIDGYNVMYAMGLMDRRFRPEGFRKARTRFLNDLAEALGAVEAHLTTVVFDAAAPPEDLPHEVTHKGMTVLFAVEDDNADELIVRLIAEHSAPKTLTVVSTDHLIRQAATRRKAQALTADAFLEQLHTRRPRTAPEPPPVSAEEQARLHGLSPQQSAAWLDVFRDVADIPEARETLGADFAPTAEEIARIEREVEDES